MDLQNETPLTIDFPEAADRHLRIRAGACKIVVRPGEVAGWFTATYKDTSGQLPLHVDVDGGQVSIGHRQNITNLMGLVQRVPTLNLIMGKGSEYAMTIETGASDGDFDLGGLPITRLVLRQGAGRSNLTFSRVNPQAMDLLQISAGAAGITARNLANANAAVMTLEGGAAGYTFDFGGILKREGYVKITTGVSSVDLILPSVTSARISTESFLAHVDVGEGFVQRDGAYWTPAAVQGHAPALRIDTSVNLGVLTLRLAEQVPEPGLNTVFAGMP
jgi:hypothetical protein